jgi:hypothetical protein
MDAANPADQNHARDATCLFAERALVAIDQDQVEVIRSLSREYLETISGRQIAYHEKMYQLLDREMSQECVEAMMPIPAILVSSWLSHSTYSVSVFRYLHARSLITETQWRGFLVDPIRSMDLTRLRSIWDVLAPSGSPPEPRYLDLVLSALAEQIVAVPYYFELIDCIIGDCPLAASIRNQR